MKKIILLSLLLGWIIFPLSAQIKIDLNELTVDKPIKIDFKEFTLDNGLHVIMHQDNTTPLVATNLLYHVGSKNENPERTGFADLFSNLMFEGTENIERGQYKNIIRSKSGTLGARSNQDFTNYFALLPSNELELALYMESERMLHAKVDWTGVEKELNLKEVNMRRVENQPYSSILPETMKRAYTTHPYQWTPSGSINQLNEATLEEFQQFYKDFYVPNNVTLTIAGDIDYVTTESMVRKYFSEIPKGTKPIYRPTITEPKKTAEVRDIIYDNIQTPAVIQAYNLPPRNHPDSHALYLLSTYLTGGNSSLMYKELVEKQQKASRLSATLLELEDGGLFIIEGRTNMGRDARDVAAERNEFIYKLGKGSGMSDEDTDKLLKIMANDMYADNKLGIDPKELDTEIDRLIKQVQEQGISEEELTKLKNIMEYQMVKDNYSLLQLLARDLVEAKVIFEDTNYINQVIEARAKVTKEDIQRVAKTYLDLNGRVVLYYLPKSVNQ
jgi:predicted Zn-dependent peptidase